jgi:hypothetical protein
VRAEDAPVYASGYVGSLPSDRALRPDVYFDRPAVRALLLELEPGPQPSARVEAALAGSGTSTEDLIRTHLLRRDGDRLAIDFAYFSRADMSRIHAVVDRRAVTLAQAYVARRAELDRLFARYDAHAVPRGDLAFVVLVGVSLNWDGLALTLERGWRAPRWVEAGAARYGFWASSDAPGRSYEGYYWGSSSFPAGPYNFEPSPVDFTFSSFGDPYSDPRMSFPDLFYLPPVELTPEVAARVKRIGLRSETLQGVSVEGVLGFSFARPTASILFALREGPKSERTLAHALAEQDAERLPAILALLQQARCVRRTNHNRFELTSPVLDRRDERLLRDALALSRQIMSEWLTEIYDSIRSEIGPLTIERHGLSYEVAFTQIWHELFGATTRELARSGVVSDPRAAGAASPGSISLLWRMSLYDLTR